MMQAGQRDSCYAGNAQALLVLTSMCVPALSRCHMSLKRVPCVCVPAGMQAGQGNRCHAGHSQAAIRADWHV
jgi:hypothetical protein